MLELDLKDVLIETGFDPVNRKALSARHRAQAIILLGLCVLSYALLDN